MRFLIDTCVISEWKHRHPDASVLEWLDTLVQEDTFFSVLTIGELTKGVLKLPESRRRIDLRAWLHQLQEVYARQILTLGSREVELWAEISAMAESKGTPIAAIDGLLAGTASAHGLAIATRNVSDFIPTGIPVFDPWGSAWHNC
ncbi:MAG: type II toxin-antitoxin system VapC family toxin [Lentisphaeria bacterium]|nr:type II toxin-antitoxin system VapC family toxin [Lentisphaeria bacterium]